MKVFVTGANGQLGRSLRKLFKNGTFVDSRTFDISDKKLVCEYDFSGYDVIINAAAYTAVDAAEDNEELARRVNVDGPRFLAMAAKKHGITLVHISSDYVFDGTQELHTETEAFSPLSVYGRTKAEGDMAVSDETDQHYILRSSWVVGDGNNFVRTMLSLGKKMSELSIVNDQIGRLTFTDDLALATKHLLGTKAEFGTYNVSNAGRPASWADIARKIFELAELDTQVVDTTTAEFAKSKSPFADRPHFSTLDVQKLEDAGFSTPDWEVSLKSYITEQNL
jgi:dTDP-4-dehydrorhamnose reductase